MKAKSNKSGISMVQLPRAEYERLLAKAGESTPGDGPRLPSPDARGNVNAVEYLRASIAREIIRRRRDAGLSQTELARAAGLRQETISNLETAKHTVTPATIAKIDRALQRLSPRKHVPSRARRSA